MNFKPLILILVFSLLVVAASASTPDFTVSQSLSTNLNVGTNSVGNIVIVKQPYIPNNVTLSTISATSAQKFDVLRWSGAQSVQITAPDGVVSILSSNQALQFIQSGSYMISLLSDPSQNATISVSTESPLTIVSTNSNSNLEVTGLGTFTVIGNELSIPIDVKVKQSDAVGDYNTQFNFTVSNNLKQFSVTFHVLADGRFNVIENTVNDTVIAQSNTLLTLGYFKLENVGNNDITVTSQISGNGSTFVSTQTSQPLYKNGQTIFNVQLQIPSSQADSIFLATVNLIAGNQTFAKNITINIHDTTAPKIINVTLSAYAVVVPVTILAYATDNIDVVNATVTIDNVLYNMTKDQQAFTFKDFYFNTTGVHTIQICAYDASNNQVCRTDSPTIAQLQYINATTNILLPTVKIGLTNQKQIFTLNASARVSFNVTLKDFTSDLLANNTISFYKMQLLDSNNVVYPLQNIGDTVVIQPSNWVTLQVYTMNISQYSGRLTFTTPDPIVTQPDILFGGTVKEYTVPLAFDKNISGQRVWSQVFDTGNYATSYQDVCQRFSLSEDESSLSLLTSMRERSIVDEKYNITINGLKSKVFFWQLATTISWAFVICALAISYFIIRVYPKMRNRK